MRQTPQQLRAKRLMKSLRLPAQLSKVLHEPRYRFPEFVDIFLNECDHTIFNSPRKGLELIRAAPKLVEQLSENQQERKQILLVRAYALLGTAYRALHDLPAANGAYSQALAFTDIPILERAHVYRRMTLLRVEEKQFDDALRFANQAIDVYRDHGEHAFYAHGLNTRGVLHYHSHEYDSALLDLSTGLQYVHPKESPRKYYSLLHNLALTLVQSCANADTMDAALENVRSAGRFGALRRHSAPRYMLRWVQGIMLVRLGMTERAEAEFITARKGLIALEVPYSMALVSLELGCLYHQDGQWEELRKLAAETFAIFDKAQCADVESLAAMTLWAESTKTKATTDAITARIRQILQIRSRSTLMQMAK